MAPHSQSESDHQVTRWCWLADTAPAYPACLCLGQDRYRGPLPTCLPDPHRPGVQAMRVKISFAHTAACSLDAAKTGTLVAAFGKEHGKPPHCHMAFTLFPTAVDLSRTRRGRAKVTGSRSELCSG